MLKLSILAVILFIVTGCATTNQAITASPMSGTVWEGTVVSKPYSAPRTKIVNDIKDNVKGADDEYAKRFVTSKIDEAISTSQDMVSFAGNNDCQSKIDYFLKKLEPPIKNTATSVSYVLKTVVGVGNWEGRPLSTDNSITTTKLSNGTYQQQFSSDMKWRNVERREATGYAKINVMTKVSCEDINNVHFKVSVPDYSIQNPGVGFGQSLALMAIDWIKVEKTLLSAPKEHVLDGEKEYLNFLHGVARSLNYKLANRFARLPHELSKNEERIYKVALDVMSSRIQRKLESYKYMTDRTRYEFSDKMAYRGANIDMITIIKVFPEEGGKTSVVFALEYSPLHDNIAEKIAFGEDDARKYLVGQIENFENLIVSR